MDILFFSDKQNVYKLKAADAADSKASALGDYLPNLLNMEPEERIVYMTATADYAGQVVFFFENGKAAKVPLSVYTTKMNRKKLVNAYSARSPLVRMQKLDAEQDLLLIRNSDKAVLLNTELIPAGATKNVSGVQVFTLKKNSALTAVYTIEEFQTENPEYYRTKKIPWSPQGILYRKRIRLQTACQDRQALRSNYLSVILKGQNLFNRLCPFCFARQCP